MTKSLKCPVCNQGDLIEGAKGYMCNHFKSLNDKCSFTIFKSYFGKEMTLDLVQQLADKMETPFFDDWINKNNQRFSAKLIIDNSVVKPQFQNQFLDTPCPKCGKRVNVVSKAFICEGFFSKECDLYFNKNVAGVALSDYDAEVLLNGSSTEYRTDFLSGIDCHFGAKLYFDESYQVKFNYELIKCPKCLSGSISVNHKAYGCSNFGNDKVKCQFTVWRVISGKEVTVKNLLDLCHKGRTEVIKFKPGKGDQFSGFFQFDKDFKLSIVKGS
ncbi:MAG: topoisomerase C-terminal repeat-containing protein [Mucilaginibacter sp.]|uniref:topoisomerase C-terminal repeat-containing protein n=1 Tax=Mucilaginibacter sp. TaxID=1882438 RepID=UPI0031B2AAC5